MRILHQCNSFLPSAIGGAEVLSYRLVRELKRRNHEVLVMTALHAADSDGFTTYDGIDVVRLRLAGALAKRDLAAMRGIDLEISKIAAHFQPDVLHVNAAELSSFFFRRSGGMREYPRVLTLHAPIRPAGKDGLQHRLTNDADRVVAVSHALREDAVATMPDVAPKISVILNALPLPATETVPLSFEPPHLLCVGRVEPEKGFDVALRAFALLRQRGSSARLTIAGGGAELEALRSLAQELGVADAVTFTDWVAPDDVPDLMNTATVVLMPSRWREPFGLVALQAAQTGRPIVASAVGGLPEVVADGETGLLVPPDDAAALARAVEDILSDKTRAMRMGENARRRADDVFDFGKFVDAYERILSEAAEIGRTGGRKASA